MQERALVGAIEGGGTKFICAVAESPTTLIERRVIPTTDAGVTLGACLQFFRDAGARHGRLTALGMACFGPLQLRHDARDYGCMLPTPKAGWSGVDLLAPFRDALQVPVFLDTDVGAAALGELRAGAGKGFGSLAYVTVGTGIGGAVAPEANSSRLMHAEMGHLPVQRDPRDTAFAGICPFHGDCLEGMASGPAIAARWGSALSALPADHPGREIVAGYIAQLATAITLLHAPERLVMGGGVMTDGSLLPRIRSCTLARLGGYLPPLGNAAAIETYMSAPALGGDSALAGAVLMALEAR